MVRIGQGHQVQRGGPLKVRRLLETNKAAQGRRPYIVIMSRPPLRFQGSCAVRAVALRRDA